MKNKFFKGLVVGVGLAVSGLANATLINFTTLGTVANYSGNTDFNVTVFGGPETDINLAPHIVSGIGLVNSSDPASVGRDYPTEDIIRFDFLTSGIDSLTVAFNAAGSTVVPHGEVRAFDYDGNLLGTQSWLNGSINTLSFDFLQDIARLELDSNADEAWRSNNNWWYAVQSIDYTQGNSFLQAKVDVPEPSSLLLVGLSMLAMGAAQRKRK